MRQAILDLPDGSLHDTAESGLELRFFFTTDLIG